MAFSAIAITAGSGTNVLIDDLSTGEAQIIKTGATKLGVEALSLSWGTTTAMSFAAGLQSLATSTTVGTVSAEVDFTAEGFSDVLVTTYVTMTTAGSPTGVVEVYGLASMDGTTYSGDVSTYTGTAAAYTLGATGSQNLRWLGSIKPHANTAKYADTFSLRAAFGTVPPFFALVIVNNSAIALHSSGNGADYRGRYG